MHLGYVNVILLCSDNRHVSATHVANFRVVSASGVLSTHYKYICILALGTLKKATRAAETRCWSLYSKIMFM
jgi:hypothetical protein